MRPTSLALPLTLAVGGGCVPRVEGETPLSDAHKVVMADLIAQEPLATPIAVALAKRMEVGMVDHTGAPTTSATLAVDITHTAAWLQKEYAEGRVMEADRDHLRESRREMRIR